MDTFNSNSKQRDMLTKPTEPKEKVFWLIDQINNYRSIYGSQCIYDSLLIELGKTIEGQYTDWLRQKKLTDELTNYQVVVLPYVSFRFLTARGRKEVDIWKASAGQIKRLIDGLLEEVLELPDNPIVRAMVKETVVIFLKFMREFQEVRVQ
jgi:hypothetical protein